MKQLLLTLAVAAAAVTATAQTPAFPGAEGHGRYVTGGRAANGSTKVYHVTNLNDSGSGSLRWALQQSGPRTIVFDVGGVIALNSDLSIPSNTTIAGQTAPYPGITLRYYTIHGIGNNVIIRFIRSRRGQEKNVNDGADAVWEREKTGIIIDHCSFSWSIDEVASFYDNNNFTMQWCTIGESLNNAGHDKGAHGYGGIWGGKLASFHHNLILHVNNRSPRFNGARYNWTGYTSNKLYSEYNWQNAVQAENVDFRNCVVYNCGNGCYGGPGGGQINMVNNYYKNGPAGNTSYITTASVANNTSSSDESKYWTMFSRYYISGNQLNSTANADWGKVHYDSGTKTKDGDRYTPDPNHYYGSGVTYVNIDGTDCVKMKMDQPAPYGEVTTHTAAVAFDRVLDYAGSSLQRDDVDKRYATETRNGTATYKGSVTGKAGRIDLVSDVNGYTEETFGTGKRAANFDADQDGMADAWEQLNGGDLQPNAYTLDSQYTNLEVYLSSLVEDIMKAGNEGAESALNDHYPTCQKLPDDPNIEPEDPELPDGQQGNVTWELSSTTTATYSTSFDSYVTAPELTMGSNLSISGNGTYGDVRFTKFTAETAESAAAESNKVLLKVNSKGGYKFRATNIAFQACKIGTDNGNFDVKWTDAGGTKVLATAVAPNRNNAGGGYFSNHSYDVTALSTETNGECTLQLNLYNIGFIKEGVMTKKEMGLANIIINGVITNTETGLSQTVSLSPTLTEYYDLQGRRLLEPRGLCIRVEHLGDGTVRTTKIVR